MTGVPTFQRLQIQYAVNTAIPVKVDANMLDDGALVSISVFYRAKPQSAPVAGTASIAANSTTYPHGTATGLWSTFKNGFSFTPAIPGFYTVTLSGLTLSSGAVTSLLTVQLERVCVVKF